MTGTVDNEGAAARDRGDTTILVVDDEPEVRSLIADYLEDDQGYSVLTATDGVDALENVLPKHRVDLVLSDINMPRMMGFDLLAKVRDQYPDTRRVLITAYNVEDYLELALEHDVGNIFVKSSPFNFTGLSVVLSNLLTNDIFGADRYFSGSFEKRTHLVTRGDRMDRDAIEIVRALPETAKARRLELVVVELVTNAVFYGVRGEPSDAKETWKHDFELDGEDVIVVDVLWDNEKLAISVLDRGGRLKKKDVLFWLHRQIARDEAGLPLGIMDSHGRGLFIARKYIDRLIINIDRDRKTEVILMNYLNSESRGYKPLHINEI